jgi:signal transduction histidine kinase
MLRALATRAREGLDGDLHEVTASDRWEAEVSEPDPRPDREPDPAPSPPADDDRQRGEDRWRRRRRLERELHDGAALRISSLALRLGLLRAGEGRGPGWERDIVELQDEVAAALQELRDVARQIYPPLLDEAGLGPALRELVTSGGTDAVLDVPDERFGPAAEGAAYFAVAECLEAAAGRTLGVRVRREDGALVLVISGADPALGLPVHDEARPLGGTVAVEDDTETDEGGATIVARFPCG